MTTMPMSEELVPCPACGEVHATVDIFCPHCGKAVGGLKYIREEFEQTRRRYEQIADTVTRFVSAPSYFGVHVFWFAIWIVLNSGLIMAIHRFDSPPDYNVLALLLGIEAVFLTGFLLVSQTREADYERKRAELDYETTVITNRLLREMKDQLGIVNDRLERIESDLRKER